MILIVDNSYDRKDKYLYPLLDVIKRATTDYYIFDSSTSLSNLPPVKNIYGIILSGTIVSTDLSSANKDILNRMAKRNIACLKKYKYVPILGICFGYNILGLYYDSHLSSTDKVKTGIINLNILKNPLSENQNVKAGISYNKYILKNDISPRLRILSSKYNKVYMFQHQNKPIWGTKFHPEFNKETHDLLYEFINICYLNWYKKSGISNYDNIL